MIAQSMNTKAIVALIWEMFARHRVIVILALVVGPLSAVLINYLGIHVFHTEKMLKIPLMIMFVCTIGFIVIFSYSEFDTSTYQAGFPAHLLRLPISNYWLSLTPYFTATIFLYVYLLVWIKGIVDARFTNVDAVLLLGCIMIGIGWLQFVSWRLNKAPLQATLVILAVLLLTALSMSSLSNDNDVALIPHGLAWGINAVLLTLSVWLPYRTIRFIRSGGESIKEFKLSDFSFSFYKIPKHLSNGNEAQLAYERRVYGWVIPMASLLLALIVLGANGFTNNDSVLDVSTRAQNAIVLTLCAYFYLVFITGFTFSKNHFSSKDTLLTSFMASRPLSTASLASARLIMLFESIVVGVLLLVTALLIGSLYSDKDSLVILAWNYLTMRQDAFSSLMLMITALFSFTALCWVFASLPLAITLHGGKRVWQTVQMGFSFVAALFIITFAAVDVEKYLPIIFNLFGQLIITLPLLFGIIAIAALWQRFKSLQGNHTIKKPVALSVVFGLFSILTIWATGLMLPAKLVFSIIILTMGIYSVLPFMIATIALTYNRHR